MEHKTIAILGGDLRTVYLANGLAEAGWAVSSVFLEDGGKLLPGVRRGEFPGALLARAEAVLLPVPALEEEMELRAPLWPVKVPLEPLLDQIPAGTPVLGGQIKPPLREALEARGLPAYDLLDREELTVDNAAYTAEDALALAIQESPRSILGARCVVVGYGRIGKILARYLAALGAKVTVTARRPEHLAWIRVDGHTPWETARLAEIVSGADILFNTVPCRVLERSALRQMKREALVIDLASQPGGVDMDSAREMGIRTLWALSLPGKMTPQAAGESIAAAVENILKERRLTQ